MKKVICLATSLVICASVFVGCSKSSTASNQDNGNQNNQGQNFGGNNGLPRIEGEVSAIDGNKVTLKLIQMPTGGRGGNFGNGQNSGQGNGQNRGQRATGDVQAPPAGGKKGTSATGDVQGPGGNAQGGQRGQGGFNRQVQYTGETKTVTIPDGVAITTFSRNAQGQGGSSTSLTVKDIKVGDRLTVTYSDSSESTISGISVMNIAQNQNQNQNQNQTQGQS
ncbi:MAG: hypothetical protein Q8930_15405 [Bacillota bacterium]|nr:hypothetical protein [Bacillota bacterium]